MANKLESGEDDDICDDMNTIIRFKEEYALSKDFTFKVGMNFFSLK